MTDHAAAFDIENLIAACLKEGPESRRSWSGLIEYSQPFLQIVFRSASFRVRGEEEDVIQEVFVRLAAGALARYRGLPERELEEQNRHFRGYLTRILASICIDRLRRKRPVSHDDPSPGGPQIEPLQWRQIHDYVLIWQRLFAGLTVDERVLLKMKYVDGKDNREIAQVLEAPYGTVCVKLKRARDKLVCRMGDRFSELQDFFTNQPKLIAAVVGRVLETAVGESETIHDSGE